MRVKVGNKPYRVFQAIVEDPGIRLDQLLIHPSLVGGDAPLTSDNIYGCVVGLVRNKYIVGTPALPADFGSRPYGKLEIGENAALHDIGLEIAPGCYERPAA